MLKSKAPLRTLHAAVVRVLIPLYVLAGAVIKLLSATPDDLPKWIQAWYLSSDVPDRTIDVLLMVIIGVELAAAGIMLLLPRATKAVAVMILGLFCFVLIAEITFYAKDVGIWKALVSGDCGCFGPAATIPPSVMLLVDAILLTAALAYRRPPEKMQPTPTWALATCLLWVVVGGALARQAPLTHWGENRTDIIEGRLRPHVWIGMEFEATPMAQYLELDPAMMGMGTQHWIFYRETCSVCHALFEEKYANSFPEGVDAVIAIRIPPPPGSTPDPNSEEIICPYCEMTELPQLDSGLPWMITSPLTVVIVDGVITDVIDGTLPPGVKPTGSDI